MLKQTLCGLAVAGAVAVAGLAGNAPSAEAGVKVYLGPVLPSYNAYGHDYNHNYHGDYGHRCHWERRLVRRKVCWRNSYGRKKCRWKKRWRKVKVC